MPKISKELYNKLTQLDRAYMNEKGQEMLNPIPFQPTGVRPKSMSLKEQIKRILKTEMSLQMHQQEMETLDEANDFDVQDGFDIEESSIYEMDDEYLGPYPGMDSPKIVESERSQRAKISEDGAAEAGEPQIPPEGGNNDEKVAIT